MPKRLALALGSAARGRPGFPCHRRPARAGRAGSDSARLERRLVSSTWIALMQSCYKRSCFGKEDALSLSSAEFAAAIVAHLLDGRGKQPSKPIAPGIDVWSMMKAGVPWMSSESASRMLRAMTWLTSSALHVGLELRDVESGGLGDLVDDLLRRSCPHAPSAPGENPSICPACAKRAPRVRHRPSLARESGIPS